MKIFAPPRNNDGVLPDEGQTGINMVDLMMWLVIAALLLAAAIQGIGYYQKATYVHLMKSDLTGVASRVMSEASLARGVIDSDVVDTAASDSNWSDEVVYLVEGSEKSPYLRASHPGVTDVDALYLFESCAPYGVGVHIVPKGGNAFLEDCGIVATPPGEGGGGGGGGSVTPPENPDFDGDGILNGADWDNDGDGKDDDEAVPAGYTAGGRTRGHEGTVSPRELVGNIESGRLANAATPTLYITFYVPYGQGGSGISMDLAANCVRADKSTYVDRRIAVYTVPAGHGGGALGTNITRCGTDRLYSFVAKTLTQESINSGEIQNVNEATNKTFDDSYRWSEPDGYAKVGNLESTAVTSGGKNAEGVFYTGDAPLGNRLVAQFKGLCERTDKTVYKVNKLVYTDKTAAGSHSVINIPVCADGRIDSYTLKPVTALSEVENRPVFTTGYSLNGTRTWEESANGYKLLGNLESIRLEGTNLVMRAYVPGGSDGRVINTQYELVCKLADGTTKKINRIHTYTHTSGSGAFVVGSVPACNSGETLMSYSFSKVHSLGIVENPDDFKTHTFDRTYSWTKP